MYAFTSYVALGNDSILLYITYDLNSYVINLHWVRYFIRKFHLYFVFGLRLQNRIFTLLGSFHLELLIKNLEILENLQYFKTLDFIWEGKLTEPRRTSCECPSRLRNQMFEDDEFIVGEDGGLIFLYLLDVRKDCCGTIVWSWGSLSCVDQFERSHKKMRR